MTRFMASLLLLAAALCWGAGNVANKTVLADLGPLTVVGLRCLLAAVVILPFAWADLRRKPASGWWPSVMGVSLLFALALALQQWAYQSATVTNASFLVNTATVLTPFLAWALVGQRPNWVMILAASLTLLGTFMLCGQHLSLTRMNLGDKLCLLSALVYAGWIVALARHAAVHGRPMLTAFVQFATCGLSVMPIAIPVETGWTWPGTAVWAALPELLMLGVVSTALAFGLMTWAQRHVAASTAAVLVSAESLFGAAGAYLVLGENLTFDAYAGAAIMLAAIVLAGLSDPGTPPAASARSARSGQELRSRLPPLVLTQRV